MSSIALHIVNDVSSATGINHESHCTWRAQYLVMLEGYTSCSVQCKCPFLGDKDQS